MHTIIFYKKKTYLCACTRTHAYAQIHTYRYTHTCILSLLELKILGFVPNISKIKKML